MCLSRENPAAHQVQARVPLHQVEEACCWFPVELSLCFLDLSLKLFFDVQLQANLCLPKQAATTSHLPTPQDCKVSAHHLCWLPSSNKSHFQHCDLTILQMFHVLNPLWTSRLPHLQPIHSSGWIGCLQLQVCTEMDKSSDCWMLIPVKQIVPSQAFSSERHQFFAGQSLHSVKWTTSRRRFQRVTTVKVEAYTKPYTKVATFPGQLETATEPPLNTYKNKEPYIGTIKSVKRIVGPNAPGETCHIVIDHEGNVPYWEGQSYGIIPPVSCFCTQLYLKDRLMVESPTTMLHVGSSMPA